MGKLLGRGEQENDRVFGGKADGADNQVESECQYLKNDGRNKRRDR